MKGCAVEEMRLGSLRGESVTSEEMQKGQTADSAGKMELLRACLTDLPLYLAATTPLQSLKVVVINKIF